MFHSVVIPTLGRPRVLAETIQSLLRQTRPADEILISAAREEDVLEEVRRTPSVRVFMGPKGASRQRNLALAGLDPRCEVVSFLDDDVELAADYLEHVQEGFDLQPRVVLFMGCVVDCAPERDVAQRVLADYLGPDGFRTGGPGLGCCMNVRRSVVDKIQFDERLALYSWLEDYDFVSRSNALGEHGTYDACRLAHLAEPAGRVSGYRFGYSQIMNPYYLWRKGTLGSIRIMLVDCWGKALIRNSLGTLLSDPKVDRWGRFRGNLLALGLICINRIEPERIERM